MPCDDQQVYTIGDVRHIPPVYDTHWDVSSYLVTSFVTLHKVLIPRTKRAIKGRVDGHKKKASSHFVTSSSLDITTDENEGRKPLTLVKGRRPSEESQKHV